MEIHKSGIQKEYRHVPQGVVFTYKGTTYLRGYRATDDHDFVVNMETGGMFSPLDDGAFVTVHPRAILCLEGLPK